jgi:hypothetical protein
MKKLVYFLPLVAVVAAGCEYEKSPTPLQPTPVTAVETPVAEPAPTPAVATEYPTSGPDVIKYVAAKYPEKLAAGISREDRVRNMEFIRDRVIEVGRCGGLGLGWNLKRGGPEISIDFITERLADGSVIGHDIAFDYDNASAPLRLYWGNGSHPYYKEYPHFDCQ